MISYLLMGSLAWADGPTAGDSNNPDDPCSTVPHNGYRRKVAYASGPEDRAIIEAYALARSQLLDEVTPGFSGLRREAIAQQIVDWKHEYSSRQACASVQIRTSDLGRFEQDAAKLEADLASLASEIVKALGGKPLHIESVLWEQTSCVADVSSALILNLRNRLAEVGGVQLQEGGLTTDTRELVLTIAGQGETLVVSATLKPILDASSILLPGFSFSRDLLKIEADGGRCSPTVSRSSGEVQIHVDLNTSAGQVCEGHEVSPTVRVSRPAYLRVFSIDGAGDTLLVWPPEGQDGQVTDSISLGAFQAYHLKSGDEKLVVVGAEDENGLGDLSGLSGFCRMANGMLAPPSASIMTATFSVIPAGTGECPWEDVLEQIAHTELLMADLPDCR